MKRYLFILTLSLLAAVACNKDKFNENGGGETNYPVPEAGVPYLLEGTVSTEGFTWKTNSSVGLYSAMDALRIINRECKIVGWADTTPVYDEEGNNTNQYTPSEYEGQATARFNTPNLDLVQGENRFMIYTPYNSELTFTNNTIYGLSIGDAQTQTAANVAADCFSLGYATGIPGVDEVFIFELSPVTALAQVHITSTELADYAPKSVTIYVEDGTTIAGGFNISLDTMEPSLISGTALDRVAVTVQNPATLSATSQQNIYLNILPVDLSSKELWVIVELEDADGAVLTIPTKQTGLKFEAGKTTTIDLSDLSTEDNAAGAWYCAQETRILAGLGYAYGQANTFLIQCKSGTYNGATLSANPDIPEEVVIDYRVRGNFANITEDMRPEGVTFEWFTLSNGATYTPRTSGYELSKVDPTQYTFTHDEANHTVTVKNTGAYAGSPILLMKKGDKILWAWTFWNIAADGTTLDPVTVGDYKFAPMDLGQPTTNETAWMANFDRMFRMNLLYQWGRPYPIFWNSYWSIDGLGATGNNIPSVYGPLSLSESLSKVGMIINEPSNQDMFNWCTENINDMWGSADGETEGEKTIYDPCPQGWRVATMPAVNALLSGTVTYDETGHYSMTASGVTFYNNGYCNAKIGETGNPAGEHTVTANRPTNMQFANATSDRGWLWLNVAGDSQGQSLYWQTTSYTAGEEARFASFNKATVMSVRCIVDDDNR